MLQQGVLEVEYSYFEAKTELIPLNIVQLLWDGTVFLIDFWDYIELCVDFRRLFFAIHLIRIIRGGNFLKAGAVFYFTFLIVKVA